MGKCDKKLVLFKNEMIQVLLNLLKNAQEALEDVDEPRIQVSIYEYDGSIKISVEDNGTGIEQGNLEKIFEPYFSTKAQQGTGLGLYMSRVIITEHMNGSLYVENTNEGTKFVIALAD